MKKTLSIFLILTLVTLCIPLGAFNIAVSAQTGAPEDYTYWKGGYATEFASGKGTTEDPYVIKTAEQLAYLSYVVNEEIPDETNGGYYYTKVYSLENDLYLNDVYNKELYSANNRDWVPIGGQVEHEFTALTPEHLMMKIEYYRFVFDSDGMAVGRIDRNKHNSAEIYTYLTHFEGTFLGNDHTIYGLKITSDTSFAGLFGISTGNIYNLNVKKAYILADEYAGGICGYATTYCTIDSCSFDGYIKGDVVGGIAGVAGNRLVPSEYYYDSIIDIINCKTYGEVVSVFGESGGIVGIVACGDVILLNETSAASYGPIAIEKCANFANVNSQDGSSGGILGTYFSDNSHSLTVSCCYNKGYIKSFVAGGIIGTYGFENKKYRTIMAECFNIGSVFGYNCAGGLVGKMDLDSSYDDYYRNGIENSYNAGQIFSNWDSGSIVGLSAFESNGAKINSLYFTNCAWVKGTAEQASAEFEYANPDYSTTGLEVLEKVQANYSKVWISDTNNSNGGFPELEEGADNCGYYITIDSQHCDLVFCDKTLASKGEKVNIISNVSMEFCLYDLYLDSEPLTEKSFIVSSNHTIKADFGERIWLSDVEIKLDNTYFVYTGEKIFPKVYIEGMTEGVDYVVYNNGALNVGEYAIHISGTGKLIGNELITFYVIKADQEKPNAPEIENITHNSIQIKTKDGCEYKLNDGEWQKEPQFNNLTPNTSYNIYQRYAETENYNASESSDATVVTTNDLLVDVSLKTKPDKLTYAVNDVLDLTGATLQLEYISGDFKVINIEPSMVTEFDTSREGDSTVSVIYNGFTVYFNIYVYRPVTNLNLNYQIPNVKDIFKTNLAEINVEFKPENLLQKPNIKFAWAFSTDGETYFSVNENDVFEPNKYYALYIVQIEGYGLDDLTRWTVNDIPFEKKIITVDATETVAYAIHYIEYIKGDINGDNTVNITDLAILKKLVAKLIGNDDATVVYPDVDLNGDVNVTDIALLKKMIAGLI